MKALRLVFHFARNYSTELLITVISMVLLVGVQLQIPWIIRSLIATVTEHPLDSGTMAYITRLTILAAVALLAKGGLQFLRSYMAHIAGWGVVADLRKHLYQHVQRLSLRFYEDKQTGQMMSRIVNDTDQFEMLIANAVPDIVVNVLTFVGVSAMLLLLTIGMRGGSTHYFDAALAIGVLGFVATAALAKFLLRGEVIE